MTNFYAFVSLVHGHYAIFGTIMLRHNGSLKMVLIALLNLAFFILKYV